MIRVSAGTAHVLGLREIKADADPTTAYLLNGEKCSNNCGFCPQARDSKDDGSHLSRIVWPEYDEDDVVNRLKSAKASGAMKRACIQFTLCNGSFDRAKSLATRIKNEVGMPLSVSLNVPSVDNARELIEAGASRVSIALDAANADLHTQIKGSSFDEKLKLIRQCVALFPGQISTHIIIGLGETEEQALKLISEMYNLDVSVGLFAFTPVRGTKLEKQSPPDIGCYRRVQIANYLLKHSIISFDKLNFEDGRLTGIDLPKSEIARALSSGKAFETAGCDGCNRPYYNERPGGTIYNYPRALNSDELARALAESGLAI